MFSLTLLLLWIFHSIVYKILLFSRFLFSVFSITIWSYSLHLFYLYPSFSRSDWWSHELGHVYKKNLTLNILMVIFLHSHFMKNKVRLTVFNKIWWYFGEWLIFWATLYIDTDDTLTLTVAHGGPIMRPVALCVGSNMRFFPRRSQRSWRSVVTNWRENECIMLHWTKIFVRICLVQIGASANSAWAARRLTPLTLLLLLIYYYFYY